MAEVDVTKLKGLNIGWRKIEYNWRDSALYALAVGADENDLLYTYEKNMKALPSFAAVPYYSAVNNEPQRPLPYPANYLASDTLNAMSDKVFPLGMHAGFEMKVLRPLDPIKGTMVYNTTVAEVYDRGTAEKGIALKVVMPVHDEAGRLVSECTSWHFIKGCGAFGGEPAPKTVIAFPEREPDVVVDSYISRTQNVLYRLTGDTNYVHVDPEIAAEKAPRPFMQGLSSFGFACRMAIQGVIPGEPERMKRLSVQMRSVAFPGTPVQLRGWYDGEGRMIFRYLDMNTGKAILDNCEFEWD